MKCFKCGRMATRRHNSKFLCDYCWQVEKYREEHGKYPNVGVKS